MTCQTLEIGGDLVHINYGPAMVEVVNRRDGEARWCFVCRKHRDFRYIVMAPAEPSYYGPHADVKCATCKTSDSDLFPGREREWE
jgi:hypothetical protein